MQSSFREYFQLFVFQKLLDWKLEKSYMKKHTCHLDLHQRSHYVTIGQEFCSKVDRQPEEETDRQPGGEVARQAKFFQPTQPIPNPIRDRSGRPGITQDVIGVQNESKASLSQEISVNSFNEELCSSDGSGRPGTTQDVISVQACSSEDSKSLSVEQTHDRSGRLGKTQVAVPDDPEVYREAETLNIDDETIRERTEADMDFKIPGLPHSIVKHSQSASVRELVQKIENHPHRHALQQDLRQNQSFNPFGFICDSDASRRYTDSFSHSENAAKITGILTIGPVVKKPQLIRNGRRIECNTANYVPFVVPGLTTSSHTHSHFLLMRDAV